MLFQKLAVAGLQLPRCAQVVFLLDQQLWTFPLEQSPFGKRFPAASRDLSFHLFCQRRKALEAAPQGVTVPTIPAASMRLMTDPFAEDIVPAGSMQSLHEALLAEKVVPEGHHGGQWVARETLVTFGGMRVSFASPFLAVSKPNFARK